MPARLQNICKSFCNFLRHGIAFDDKPPSDQESRFIELIAEKAEQRHLTFPLLIFAEGLRPASFIASSFLTAAEPLAELLFSKEAYGKLISFIGNRENLDQLVAALTRRAPREGPQPGYFFVQKD